MKKFKFKNGDQMDLFGLGTWKSEPGEVYIAIREAINLGYRHFDCSPLYGNEPEIGQAFQDAIKEGDITREDLWLTTKLWNNRHRKEQVVPAIEESLKAFGTEYIDLYLIHWPVVFKDHIDFATKCDEMISLDEIPISQTWLGMEEVFNNGMAKHIGVSNFSLKKLKNLFETATIKPEANQVEMHPLLQQKELVNWSNEHNIITIAYSPLGSSDRPEGLKLENEPPILENPTIIELAAKNNCSPAQLIIAWNINRGVSVIPKSINPIRLKENFEANKIILSGEDMLTIASLDKNHRLLDGWFFSMPGSPYTKENLWDE